MLIARIRSLFGKRKKARVKDPVKRPPAKRKPVKKASKAKKAVRKR